MPFSGIEALNEMQTTSFKIWTRVVESTFYDDNRYANCAFF